MTDAVARVAPAVAHVRVSKRRGGRGTHRTAPARDSSSRPTAISSPTAMSPAAPRRSRSRSPTAARRRRDRRATIRTPISRLLKVAAPDLAWCRLGDSTRVARRPDRDRDRQSVRLSAHGDRGHRQRARPLDARADRAAARQRAADGRRAQSRQLGRAAGRRARRRDRRQHGRDPSGAGHLLRDRRVDRRARGDRADSRRPRAARLARRGRRRRCRCRAGRPSFRSARANPACASTRSRRGSPAARPASSAATSSSRLDGMPIADVDDLQRALGARRDRARRRARRACARDRALTLGAVPRERAAATRVARSAGARAARRGPPFQRARICGTIGSTKFSG